jgi:integrase
MDIYKKTRTQLKGLNIKNGSYFLRKMIKGEYLQTSIGRVDLLTIKEAEDLSIDTIRQVEAMGLRAYKALQSPSVSSKHSSNAMTLHDLLEDMLEHGRRYGTKKTSYKPWRSEYIENLKKYVPNRWKELLTLPVASITKDHIKQHYLRWLDIKWNGKEAITSAEDALRLLSRVFNWGVGKEFIDFNPCDSIMKSELRVKPSSLRADSDVRFTIADGELGKFLGGLISYKPKQVKRSYITVRDAIIFALMTGARKKEILNLQWDWFNNTTEFAYYEAPAEADRIGFDGTKTRVDYYYPCSILVQDMMKARFKNRNQLAKELGGNSPLKYVFPNNNGTGALTKVSKTLQNILTHCGIKHKTLHDFRKTFEDICEQESDEGKVFPDRIIKRAIHHASSDITFGLYAMKAPDKRQLHQIYQHVENFCSMSLGGGTMVDIFGEATTYSATVRIATDNETEIDDRSSNKNELRLALYNDEYDYDHPIPIGDFAHQEKAKIKTRLGLDEDIEFEKWTKDKTASNDLADWNARWTKILKEALDKYNYNKN